MGEERQFKKSAVGGFNRKDVIEYIEQLLKELEEAKTQLKRRDDRIDELERRLEQYEQACSTVGVIDSVNSDEEDDAISRLDAILAKYGFGDTNFKYPVLDRVESGITPDKKYVIYSDNAFPPFEFLDPQTKTYIGIDMDLLAAVAKDQGFEYEIHNYGFEEAISALKSGKADAVIAGMSAKEERKHDFDFSDGYFEDGQILVVPIDSDIKSVYDLKQN